jgi:hypothetical protein
MGKVLTLASDEELEDLALEFGATIERDGEVFNAAGRKVVRMRRKNEGQKLPPAPPTPTLSLDVAPLLTKIETLVETLRDNRQVKVEEKIVEVEVPAPAPAQPPQVVVQQVQKEVLSWTFQVKRGSMGLAKEIIATPVLGTQNVDAAGQHRSAAGRVWVFELRRNQSGELERIEVR